MADFVTHSAGAEAGIIKTASVTETITVSSRLKSYLGGIWVAKPLKVYSGGVWVEKDLKFHDGSTWI